MNKIPINTDRKFSATVVPNLFIDRYMPAAKGAYVKVYLYLLRCLSGTGDAFSLSTAADAIDETEKDIMRALSYWEKCNVLTLGREGDTLSCITLLELDHDTKEAVEPAKTAGTLISLEKHRKDMRTEPEQPAEEETYRHPVYTEAELVQIRENSNITFVLNAVELYLERLLTEQDVSFVAYLYDKLHFSADLILYLYEYCISKNKKKREYIEKVAISWHKEGLDTVAKAQEYSLLYDTCFHAVNKGFSLGRLPIGPERDFVKKWSSYQLSPELITEACGRTILNIGKPDFKYADRILESWHNAGAASLADVEKLDAGHARQAKSGDAVPGAVKPMTKSAASYNSYPQRQYTGEELSDLEQRLLQM